MRQARDPCLAEYLPSSTPASTSTRNLYQRLRGTGTGTGCRTEISVAVKPGSIFLRVAPATPQDSFLKHVYQFYLHTVVAVFVDAHGEAVLHGRGVVVLSGDGGLARELRPSPVPAAGPCETSRTGQRSWRRRALVYALAYRSWTSMVVVHWGRNTSSRESRRDTTRHDLPSHFTSPPGRSSRIS